MMNELTSLIVLWPFLNYCKMAAAVLKKKSHPGSRQEKGCYGQQVTPFEEMQSFPKSTQQTSAHSSLAITRSQGYGWAAKYLPLPDSPVQLHWEEGGGKWELG